VLLAGDFYTVPALDKRGGSGDVLPVWNAFAADFDWVVGVAGNHDTFAGGATRPRLTEGVHFLDNDRVSIGGVSIAGLSGITGNPRRPWRRTDDDYADTLSLLLCEQPAITVLHDGPDVPTRGFRGSPRIRAILEEHGRGQSKKTLVVRGHSHWNEPLAELECGTQVLNVDARVVILTEKET
jgi:Icc-related predicted phosphoesterase